MNLIPGIAVEQRLSFQLFKDLNVAFKLQWDGVIIISTGFKSKAKSTVFQEFVEFVSLMTLRWYSWISSPFDKMKSSFISMISPINGNMRFELRE